MPTGGFDRRSAWAILVKQSVEYKLVKILTIMMR
jgi:hypothetical protein